MSGDWLTYAEAAARLGIKPESVKKRAIRRGWARQAGNDGLARIRLPDDLPPGPVPGPMAPDMTGDAAGDRTGDDTRERLVAAETEIRLLRERLADLTADRDALRDALARAAASHARPPEPGFIVRTGRGLLGRLRGRQ